MAFDTGSTGHYLPENMIAVQDNLIVNIQPTKTPIYVIMPDNTTIASSHTCNLDLPSLPPNATKGHIFPAMGPTALLSIGELCDAGCTAQFDANECQITFMNNTILTGQRNATTYHLWHLNQPPTAASIDTTTPPTLNALKHVANLFTTTASATPADLPSTLLLDPSTPGARQAHGSQGRRLGCFGTGNNTMIMLWQISRPDTRTRLLGVEQVLELWSLTTMPQGRWPWMMTMRTM
jgi:hypothetical protein